MEREEAVKSIETLIFQKTPRLITDDDKRALIEAIKALDMPEYYGPMRPRGEWSCIYYNNIPNFKYECSWCKMVVRVDSAKGIKHYRFCPRCGAIMEVEE